MNVAKYSRQILFAPIGAQGQERLRASSAVIIGCGALGTAHASALARAGIGRLRIVDRDFVEESNLQRQMLFDEADAAANLPKAIAAERHLQRINSEVAVEGIVADAESGNMERLVTGFDVILDGTDNFETRYLVNDAALKLGIPWIYGAVVASYATTLTVMTHRPQRPEVSGVRHPTPCLACVFPERPKGLQETCDTVGVISPAVAWAAAVQVAEALKILTGQERECHGMLLAYDIWRNRLQQVRPRVNPACRACQRREFIYLEGHERSQTTLLCGRDTVQIRRSGQSPLDLAALRARLEPFGPVRANEYLLRCRIDAYEITVFADGRALVKGTDDSAVARALYARYIGS